MPKAQENGALGGAQRARLLFDTLYIPTADASISATNANSHR
jgi:hypothetical protein